MCIIQMCILFRIQQEGNIFYFLKVHIYCRNPNTLWGRKEEERKMSWALAVWLGVGR